MTTALHPVSGITGRDLLGGGGGDELSKSSKKGISPLSSVFRDSTLKTSAHQSVLSQNWEANIFGSILLPRVFFN